MKKGRKDGTREAGGASGPLRGIVINRGAGPGKEKTRPRIAAFIWGGKVRPTPTLPYGRWKGAA